MNLADIQQQVRESLDENETVSVRYPDDTIAEYVIDGARWYCTVTGCRNGSQTITQQADTLFYSLDYPCIRVDRVSWVSGGLYYPVVPTVPKELDRCYGQRLNWTMNRAPRATLYFFEGLAKIALYPESDDAGQQYIVHYRKDPGTSITGPDVVPLEDHQFLVNYCLARCLAAEGKVADAVAEYGTFKEGVEAAKRRMSSMERTWAMGSGSYSGHWRG